MYDPYWPYDPKRPIYLLLFCDCFLTPRPKLWLKNDNRPKIIWLCCAKNTKYKNTWLKQYDSNDWNIHHIISDPVKLVELINRTNNPLERYNQKMNQWFTHGGRPSMIQFVDTIQALSQKSVDDLAKVMNSQYVPYTHARPTIYQVPDAYELFVPLFESLTPFPLNR